MSPILYKYCDERGIDILTSLRLKVTRFNELNDPLELAPRMRPDLPIDSARAAVNDPEVKDKMFTLLSAQGLVASREHFEATYAAYNDLLALQQVHDYPEAARQFREWHMQKVSKEFGIICLSAIANNLLMWAHYTHGHTGLVIGFDASHSFFSSPTTQKVEYKSERVLMGHWSDMRDIARRRQIIEALICTKSPDWNYEVEWRQLNCLVDCIAEKDPQRPGRINHYRPIQPEMVREVIAGIRCNAVKIVAALESGKFRHVQRKRMAIHDSEFRLVSTDGF